MFLYWRKYENSGEEPEGISMSHVPASVAGNISAAQDAAIRRPGSRATIGVDLHPRHGRTRYSVEYYPGPDRGWDSYED